MSFCLQSENKGKLAFLWSSDEGGLGTWGVSNKDVGMYGILEGIETRDYCFVSMLRYVVFERQDITSCQHFICMRIFWSDNLDTMSCSCNWTFNLLFLARKNYD